MTERRALVELIFAGSLWGFGFVTTIWALRDFGPAELLIWRFIIALVVGGFFWALSLRQKGSPGFSKVHFLRENLLAAPAGFLLTGLLLPQTIGLQSTSASKSGFLTSLYVIFVPLFARVFLNRRVKIQLYFYAFLALFGAFLLTGSDLSSLNPGDLWTLLCAVLACVHILYIEKVSAQIRDSFLFNLLQTFYCLITIVPFLILGADLQEHKAGLLSWFSVGMLAIGSTVIAFTIQIRAQKVLDSTTASMMFLLESPFALLFGILFLKETLGWSQFFGALLILAAAALTVRSFSFSDSNKTPAQ